VISVEPPVDTSLDCAERWLRDGLQMLRPPFSVSQATADMTHATRRLEELSRGGVHVTFAHLLVHAVAGALAANPNLQQLIVGNRRHFPERVDIRLSASGETSVAPVLVLEGADKKTVVELAEETQRRAVETRDGDQRMLQMLRRWGWLVPFEFLRLALFRALFTSRLVGRKGAGTFQVSTVPMDWGLSSSFNTPGVLVGGQVRSRVVVVDGKPAVRPTMILTLCADHGVWDGRGASRFLANVKAALEAA
jgi:pyruvate/2-oxoglutarate dehydrogenase complex dihydrolipoamide acyltransferase (E2) component